MLFASCKRKQQQLNKKQLETELFHKMNNKNTNFTKSVITSVSIHVLYMLKQF